MNRLLLNAVLFLLRIAARLPSQYKEEAENHIAALELSDALEDAAIAETARKT